MVIAALMSASSAVQIKSSPGSQAIIDSAVHDVLKIASGKEPFEGPVITTTGVYHAPYPVPVPVHHPVPVPVDRPVPVAVDRPVPVPVPVHIVAPAYAPPSGAPNSKVIKAIAASNEAQAMKKVEE